MRKKVIKNFMYLVVSQSFLVFSTKHVFCVISVRELFPLSCVSDYVEVAEKVGEGFGVKT